MPSKRRTTRRRCYEQLIEAQHEIEALSSLPDLVSDAGDAAAAPDPKNAFFVWSQTVFARDRLTSAVELYIARAAHRSAASR